MINFNIFFFKRCILYASDENLNKEDNYNSIENEYNELLIENEYNELQNLLNKNDYIERIIKMKKMLYKLNLLIKNITEEDIKQKIEKMQNNIVENIQKYDQKKTQILNQNIADKIFKSNLDIVDKSSITITEADINNIIYFLLGCLNKKKNNTKIYKNNLNNSNWTIPNLSANLSLLLDKNPRELIGEIYIILGGIKFNIQQIKIKEVEVFEITQASTQTITFNSQNQEYTFFKDNVLYNKNGISQKILEPNITNYQTIQKIFSDINKMKQDLIDFVYCSITKEQEENFIKNQLNYLNSLAPPFLPKKPKQFFIRYKSSLFISVLFITIIYPKEFCICNAKINKDIAN